MFYQDLANPAALAAYDRLVRETEIGDIIAATWGQPDVWFMYEQVFRKEHGDSRRTSQLPPTARHRGGSVPLASGLLGHGSG
ncbi:MAG: hypothetical protein RIC56_20990 [Pseudomonadales bacterium]